MMPILMLTFIAWLEEVFHRFLPCQVTVPPISILYTLEESHAAHTQGVGSYLYLLQDGIAT